MADANRIALSYVEEDSYGETPTGSATQFKKLRFTSESLKQNTDIVESQEIRPDRQVNDVIRTSVSAGGNIDFELSYGVFDDFLEAMLMSSGWSSLVSNTDTSYSMDNATNSINDDTNGFVSDGFAANQWVEIRGFTTAANNGYFKTVSVAAGRIVLEGGTVTDEIKGDSVTIDMGAQILNGTTERFFSIEKQYTDLSSKFAILTGMEVDTLDIDVSAENIITGSFGFIGKDETSAAATATVVTASAAATNPIFSAVDDAEAILENMSSLSIMSFSMSVVNNLRIRSEVGEVGPASIGTGAIGVTGSLQVYLNDETLLDKYLDQTPSQLTIILEDSAGNVYIIDLPQVRYTDGGRVAGSSNSDIIADLSWSAYRDTDEDVTIRITRFAA